MRYMRHLLLIVFAQSCAATAAEINTDIFSLEIPDQWQVQGNITSPVIIATGSNVIDGVSLPFLSIQSCIIDNPSKFSNLHRCDKPCSERSLNSLRNQFPEGYDLTLLSTQNKPNGVVEYVAKMKYPGGFFGLVGLSCSSIGQAYISLVSDQPMAISRDMFTRVLRSLKWK